MQFMFLEVHPSTFEIILRFCSVVKHFYGFLFPYHPPLPGLNSKLSVHPQNSTQKFFCALLFPVGSPIMIVTYTENTPEMEAFR